MELKDEPIIPLQQHTQMISLESETPRPEGPGWYLRLWNNVYRPSPSLEGSSSESSDISSLSNLLIENVDAPLFRDVLKHMQEGESLKSLLRKVEMLLGEESTKPDFVQIAAEEYKKEMLFRQEGGYIRDSEMDSAVESGEEFPVTPKREKQFKSRAATVKPKPASYREPKRLSHHSPEHINRKSISCIPFPRVRWARKLVSIVT